MRKSNIIQVVMLALLLLVTSLSTAFADKTFRIRKGTSWIAGTNDSSVISAKMATGVDWIFVDYVSITVKKTDGGRFSQAGYFKVYCSGGSYQDIGPESGHSPTGTDKRSYQANSLQITGYFYPHFIKIGEVKSCSLYLYPSEGGGSRFIVGGFSIEAYDEYINIESPSSRDVLYKGDSTYIKWDDNFSGTVDIDLYKGSRKITEIKNSTASDGSYRWGIPSNLTSGSDYNIRMVNNADGDVRATSANFSISSLPELSLSPSSENFGDQNLNTSGYQSFTLRNRGEGTATGYISLVGSDSSDYRITSGSGSFSLSEGQSKSIRVRFTPTSEGRKEASLFVNADSPVYNVSASLIGTGTRPRISLSNVSKHFGGLEINKSAYHVFTLTNNGSGTANGSIRLSDTSHYRITSGGGSFSLSPGSQRNIRVGFTPTSTGTKTSTLEINGTGGTNNVSANLTGIGNEPPNISVTPNSSSFGSQLVNSESDPVSFTLKNTGGGTAKGNISLSGADQSQFDIVIGGGSYSIGSGRSHTVKVLFHPKSEGSKNATLFIDGSIPSANHSVNLAGTGVKPEVSLSLTTHNFGNQEINTSGSTQTFKLSNSGSATASGSVQLSSTSHYRITSGGGNYSLSPGSSKNIAVQFLPTATGTQTATLQINGTSGTNSVSAALTGVGTEPPNISVTPNSSSFGSQLVNSESDPVSFTLKNTGGGTATGNISLSGTDQSQFEIVTGGGSYSLNAGMSHTIKVLFHPKSEGSKSATLYIDGATPAANHSVNLTGTGIKPEVVLNQTSHNFGEREINTAGSTQTFKLNNSGSATAFGSVQLSDTTHYQITAGGGSYNLAPGSSKNIEVQFLPTATGTQTATLQVSGTDGTNSTSAVLTGVGAEPPKLSLNPASTAFGSQLVNTKSTTTVFTLKNTGGGVASGSVALTGTNNSDFTIVSGGGAYSLTGGSSKAVTVLFHPKSEGTKEATLLADGSKPIENLSVSLTGTAVQPVVEASQNNLAFDTLIVNETIEKSFTITNSGSGIAKGSITLTGTNASDFAITSGGTSFELSANQSKSVTVRFAPGSIGDKTASIDLTGENGTNSLSVALQGKGLKGPVLSLSSNSKNFEAVTIGTKQEALFTLTNSGDTTASGTISLGGTDVTEFALIIGQGSFSLQKGESAQVLVAFEPTATGAKNAILSIKEEGKTNSLVANLTGVGEEPVQTKPQGDVDGNGALTGGDAIRMNFCVTSQEFLDAGFTQEEIDQALGIRFETDCNGMVDFDGDGLIKGSDSILLQQCVTHNEFTESGATVEESNQALGIEYSPDCDLVNQQTVVANNQ